MKLGVATFSYAGPFVKSFERDGYRTVNLGDFAQAIAARSLFRRLGALDTDIVEVDRDTLPGYRGERVALLMNAVFHAGCFPIPEAVIPIFVGFAAPPKALATHAGYLRKYQPIGCRDEATAAHLRALGIAAFISGCVTLTLEARQQAPATPRPFVVYGSGAGALPQGLLAHAPREVLDSAEFVFHRATTFEIPLPAGLQRGMEKYEADFMNRIATEASLVITPLHHVAAPCMAMGIPVILCRNDDDGRFGFLARLTPLYTPDRFVQIDWSPAPVAVHSYANAFQERVRGKIEQFCDGLIVAKGG